jgi:MFS family permease
MFWLVVAVGFVLTLARVSEAFLVLRATGAGLRPAFAPAVLVGMSAVYALTAYPAGRLADRISRRFLLVLAVVSLSLAEAVLALGNTLPLAFAGILLWGVHLALSQGLLSMLVAAHVPADLRGTGFGLFNFASAIALLIGNAVFGGIWTIFGPAVAYFAAAGVALSALALLPFMRVQNRQP